LELDKSEQKLRNQVRKYYLEILEREPDNAGLKNCVDHIKEKKIKLEQIPVQLRNSKEYKKLQQKKVKADLLRKKIPKPIFVIGTPRSGTSLLYHWLCSHPDLAWFSIPDIANWIPDAQKNEIKKRFQKFKEKGEKFPADENALLTFGDVLFNPKDFEHLPAGPYPIEGETFWLKHFGTGFVDDISIDTQTELVKGIIDVIRKQKKLRFLNKAPQNVMRLKALGKIFPDAHFINISRDPRSVVSSSLRRNKVEGHFDFGVPIKDKTKYDQLDQVGKYALGYGEISDTIFEFSKK